MPAQHFQESCTDHVALGEETTLGIAVNCSSDRLFCNVKELYGLIPLHTVMSPGGSLSYQFFTLRKIYVIYKYFCRGGKIILLYRSQLHKERRRVRVFIQ